MAISRRQIGWYLGGRILTAALILIATVTYQQLNQTKHDFDPLRWLYLAALLFSIESLAAFIFSRFLRRFELFLQSQIAWDLLFITLLVFLTGGIESPFAFLFILVILSASIFFRQRQTLIVAAASAILYGSLIDLQYFGYIPLILLDNTSSLPTARTVLYDVYANILAFFLSAFLGGILSVRLRRSEEALKEKQIDYEELDRLNRAIVANIGSGIMTINPAGKIRVFNHGAERIIGLSQSEAYDRDVRDILPALAIYDGAFQHTRRNEGTFVAGNGRKLTLGFTTTLIAGVGKKEDNLLISFQDLTHLKEIEEQLRRNDRLVAVGQLSAGLAHEIRNPLASISGSVQLLIEGGSVSVNDQQLLHIVLREAERLNLLLGDFLRFARPTPPTLLRHDLALIFNDLLEVVKADPRFGHIQFLKEYGSSEFLCDDGQLRQALLNLLINAAEAINGAGTIRLGAAIDHGVTIRVEDSGPGLPPEVQKQLFNPFFTTKENGTGLGLATVHTIVNAHGGRIEVSKSNLGGAAFTLVFDSKTR
ncbi:MAG: PAS domain S-box protein [Desulfuromonadales bacterium]|nr:PAS domain S-box protein [Desulfuromonadales bacterium]